jgi:SagB-type dehydrogenase family enzyme
VSDNDRLSALDYHERTKHSEQRLRRERHVLDWANQPLPFKIYEDAERLEAIPLPRDYPAQAVPVFEAIAAAANARDDRRAEQVPDLAALSRLLHLSAGITKLLRRPGGEIAFRAHPNTGALYHVDLYLVAAELPDLPAGVYHFGPHDFALRRLRAGDFRGALARACGASPRIAHAPVVVASASTFWRNAWKYRERAWRHCFWDAGTLHANLLALAGGEGLAPELVLGYADREVERLLGLDPAREGSLALVPLGRVSRPPPEPPELPELRLATRPLSPAEVDYPAIRAAHAGSSLDSGTDAAAWRGEATRRAEPAARGTLVALRPLAASALPSEPLERVIRRRGSTRAFDPTRGIAFEELSTLLEAAAQPIPADFLGPAAAALADLYVIAHAVDGLAPGAYFLRRGDGALERLREGEFRAASGRLALGQGLAADAAANVYCLAELERVVARFGNRGYRAAQLEGGVTGGRLYLGAYALGFGATGLTFFDDEVTHFLSPHAAGRSVLFLTALGHPDRARLRGR